MLAPRCWTLLGAFLISRAGVSADQVVLELHAGEYERAGTPVSVVVPDSVELRGVIQLAPSDGAEPVAVQRVPGEEQRVTWVVRRPLAAGAKRRYVLTSDPDSKSQPGVAVTCERDGDDNIAVNVRGRPVIRYNGAVTKPPGPGFAKFASSGFIHPVTTPGGAIITDVFAPDHRHQRGIFFAWTKSFFEGRELNFWEVQAGKGRDEHVKVEAVEPGAVFGRFVARRRFVDLTAPGGPKPVLYDTWTVTVYDVPGGHLFDLESLQTCATDSAFTAGPYHYGAMAVRGIRQWLDPENAEQFSMRTSDGLDRKEGNHTRPDWVDFGGGIAGAKAGLTVFGHPKNARAPQHARLHPSKPYFCFFPMLNEALVIEPGAEYRSRFRFFVYDGDKDAQRAARMWRDYAEPPEVVVME